jgi:hypothetical protein
MFSRYMCNVRPTERSIDMGTLPDTPGLLAISDLELKLMFVT